MSIEKLDLEKFKEYHRLLSKEYREGLSQKDYDRKRYLENRDEIIRKRRTRYKQNPEHQKLLSRIYYKDNKEAILRASKEYRLRNLERCRERARNYRGSILGRLQEYKSRSRNKNIEFTLSEIEFSELLNGKCHYCGEVAMGIDRLDCIKGYTKENSVPCCKICNYMKREHSYEFFLNHIRKIVNYKQ